MLAAAIAFQPAIAQEAKAPSGGAAEAVETSPRTGLLPAFTPLKVMLNEELSSQGVKVGDPFTVTVLEDVLHQNTVVIPKGALGRGEVTFASRKGGFGKPGIIGIALRTLDLDGRQVELDGR